MENNKKKNVAILSWSLNSGGAERAAANLSKDLSDKYNGTDGNVASKRLFDMCGVKYEHLELDNPKSLVLELK